MNEMNIKGILIDNQSGMPVLLMKEVKGDRQMVLEIGPSEASSIITVLEKVIPPRPLTHDIISIMFTRHKFKLLKVEIYPSMPDKCQAYILYKAGIKKIRMEVRPSDAVALAVRRKAPILVSEDLITSREKQFFETLESYVDPEHFLYLNFHDNSCL